MDLFPIQFSWTEFLNRTVFDDLGIDPNEALEQDLEEFDEREAGRTPRRAVTA